jgi:hypothetical protein
VRDLETHEIAGIVETAVAGSVGRRQPLRADDDEHDPARSDRAVERLGEVDAGSKIGDVHEHRLVTEPLAHAVEEPARVTRGVFPPVADENVRHRPGGYQSSRRTTPT